MISEHPITARKGSPDLMEHVAGVIKEVLDELDGRRKSIIEAGASNWPPFLQTPLWREEMLARQREVDAACAALERDALERERQRTASGSQKPCKRGDRLEKIILEALAEVTRHIRPAYPEKRGQIVTRALNETNARLKALVKERGHKAVIKELGRVTVGRPCVRQHLAEYWAKHPGLAPLK
jgi:hypothetical protein